MQNAYLFHEPKKEQLPGTPDNNNHNTLYIPNQLVQLIQFNIRHESVIWSANKFLTTVT